MRRSLSSVKNYFGTKKQNFKSKYFTQADISFLKDNRNVTNRPTFGKINGQDHEFEPKISDFEQFKPTFKNEIEYDEALQKYISSNKNEACFVTGPSKCGKSEFIRHNVDTAKGKLLFYYDLKE